MYNNGDRTYQAALAALNGLQSNQALINRWKETRRLDLAATLKAEMAMLCARAGVDLDKLASRAIHVAGTKGKGSTCAMTESFLRASGLKTGLYTSPHLISVRERIKLNGLPLTPDQFTFYFWQVYDAINNSRDEEWPHLPAYFKFLTVLAFKVFQEENVDAAIIEVGIGGRTDSTNVIPSSVVTGLTTLDYDHMEVLGSTLEEIAFEKGGIMKPNTPSVHVPQVPGAERVFRSRAKEVGAILFKTPTWEELVHANNDKQPQLALDGDYQRLNSLLAVSLAQIFLLKRSGLPLPPSVPPPSSSPSAEEDLTPTFPLQPLTPQFLTGFQQVFWPGRSHSVSRVFGLPLTLCLDGGHTEASLQASAQWWLQFHQQRVDSGAISDSKMGQRILIFNCKQSKPAATLLSALLEAHEKLPYTRVWFVASKLRNPRDRSNALTNILNDDVTPQQALGAVWEEEAARRGLKVPPHETFPAIEDSLEELRKLAQHSEEVVYVHVTGSLYLVGGFLDAIGFEI